MEATTSEKSPRAGEIVGVLILGAVVANINLGIANVALPEIGGALDAGQAQLNLIAVSFTLGLASSVLHLGALADRYGRKRALVLGATLSIPTAMLAAWAPTTQEAPTGGVLRGARCSGSTTIRGQLGTDSSRQLPYARNRDPPHRCALGLETLRPSGVVAGVEITQGLEAELRRVVVVAPGERIEQHRGVVTGVVPGEHATVHHPRRQ